MTVKLNGQVVKGRGVMGAVSNGAGGQLGPVWMGVPPKNTYQSSPSNMAAGPPDWLAMTLRERKC